MATFSKKFSPLVWGGLHRLWTERGALVSLPLYTFSQVAVLFWMLLAMQVVFVREYFGLDTWGSLSHPALDGHCRWEAGEGIGKHCFGDFSQIFGILSNNANPWSPAETSYPPAALLVFLAAKGVAQLPGTPPNAALIGYLVLMALGMVIAFFLIARSLPKSLWVSALVLAGPISFPAIVAFDRGNSAGFLVLPVTLFAIAAHRKNHSLATIAIIFAAVIKPQFMLMVIFFIIYRHWKYLSLVVVGYVFAHLATSAVFFSSSFPENTWTSIQAILMFEQGQFEKSALWPANQSLTQGIYMAAMGLVQWEGARAIVVLLLVAASFSLFLRRPESTFLPVVFVLAVSGVGASGVAWAYYGVISIGIFAYVFESVKSRTYSQSVGLENIRVGPVALLVAMTSVPLILPMVVHADLGLMLTSLYLNPLIWVLVVVISAFSTGFEGPSGRFKGTTTENNKRGYSQTQILT